MVIEVITTVANNGTVNFTRIYRTKATRTPIPIEKVLENPSIYRFIFQNPLDLHKLFEDPTPRSVAICQGMKKLRLDLLRELAHQELTSHEVVLGDRHGPNARPLLENWRIACRVIPKNHGIEELTFDVSCPEKPVEVGMAKRLIQLLSTTMVLKAEQNLHCSVQGSGDVTELQMFVVSQ